LLSVIHRFLVSAWNYCQRRWAKLPDTPNLQAWLPPIRLLIISLAIHATLARFSTSLVARQAGSITETLILIVGLAWFMIIINRRCEDYLKKRMESQGRLGSTAILRTARARTVVIFSIIGFSFALHSFDQPVRVLVVWGRRNRHRTGRAETLKMSLAGS
jgi:hypothetical protein